MSHGHFYAIPQSFIRVWFLWESRLQHKFTWWLQVLWIFFWNFWNLKNFMEILKFWTLKFFFLILEIRKYLKILKLYENFEILWKFRFFCKIFEILKFFEILEILNFFFFYLRVFVNKWWSPSVLNKYKTVIQSGRGTKNPRKRFTLPVHSLKNYGPLNSQTTGKEEQ